MKKLRIPFLVTIGVLLVLFIIGSVFDKQIAAKIFDDKNTFGITLAAFGLIPGFALLEICAGIMLFNFLDKNKAGWLRAIILILSIIALCTAIYFQGDNMFDENGFYNKDLRFVGIAISAPIAAIFYFLGYLIGNKLNNQDLWKVMIVILIGLFICMFAMPQGLKIIFHRPRYRIAVYREIVEYHPWWKRCSNYKDYLSVLSKEEFKSFPSGHSTVAFLLPVLLGYLPMFFKRLKKYQIPLFCLGAAYAFVIAYSRMMVGAHYLSDVSCGGLITMVTFCVINEIFIRKPTFNKLVAAEE